MGMPVYKLVAQFIAYISYIKLVLLLSYLRIEDHVEEKVAEFLADIGHIFLEYGIGKLISFLDSLRTQGIQSLLVIPRTLLTERIHNVQQSFKGCQFPLSLCFHRCVTLFFSCRRELVIGRMTEPQVEPQHCIFRNTFARGHVAV